MRSKFFVTMLATLSLISTAQSYERFGFTGRDGRNGTPGSPGTSGQSMEYFAGGTPQYLNLDGTRGGDAFDAEDGENAQACFQRLGDYDMYGADGGNAGRGGDGGYGGSAGNPTIYYQNSAHLSHILISAIGGEGGRGSRAGREGRGCFCQHYNWEVERCTTGKDSAGKPTKVCQKYFHNCRDGQTGYRASAGKTGTTGSLGTLTIIKADQRLQQDNPSQSIGFSSLITPMRIPLSENIFDTKSGAMNILARGSKLNDAYHEFRERAEKLVNVTWRAARDLAAFKQNSISARLQNGFVTASIVGGDMFLRELIQTPAGIEMNIKEAYHPEELKQLEVKLEGVAQDVVMSIKDKSPRQDLLKDAISITIYRKRFILGFHKVYQGLMPADLMQKSGDTLIMKLGRMDFPETPDTFNAGTTIKVELNVDRVFNNEYKLNHQGTHYDNQ